MIGVGPSSRLQSTEDHVDTNPAALHIAIIRVVEAIWHFRLLKVDSQLKCHVGTWAESSKPYGTLERQLHRRCRCLNYSLAHRNYIISSAESLGISSRFRHVLFVVLSTTSGQSRISYWLKMSASRLQEAMVPAERAACDPPMVWRPGQVFLSDTGTRTSMRTPSPGRVRTLACPPALRARALMPIRPRP